MKTRITRAEIERMIVSAPDIDTADKIIEENYGFVTYGEKIAFLRGMFGTEFIGEVNNNWNYDSKAYFTMLKNILLRDNRAIKKTLTIPAWLNDMAEERGIKFSYTLQEALKEKLGLKKS